MNKLEKIIELSNSKGYANLEDECDVIRCVKTKSCLDCSVSKVLGVVDCELFKLAEQLLEEYVEPKKLTKRERAFCEYAQKGWIAREINNGLIWSNNEPQKGDGIVIFKTDTRIQYLIDGVFEFITWESEPYSVEEMLTWEVED